jgi:predicted ATPase/DNA-binding SARP family transcriptional activator
MSTAEVRVLGAVEVLANDGAVISLPAKKARLFAALVLAGGRVCQMDDLIEAVWSGSAPASARNLVQVYVSQLRKALPAGIDIVTRARGYVLELGAGSLDAARFERLLEEAAAAHRDGNPALAASLAGRGLELWRGRAFGELAHEEFVRAESERLEELRLDAVETRLEAQLDLGRHEEVLGEALALALQNPYRERVHILAMLVYYRAGRQKDALEHYAAVRHRLNVELGLEPGPQLRELQRRILQQDPALSVGDRTIAADASLPVPLTPLLGRTRELDELQALLARRDARLIVLTGAGGSGKTRLALEAVRRAAHSYANGVGVVELGPLRDPAHVIPTIARTVGVADTSADIRLETLVATLAPQELLLLVDNAEHVREAAPSLARLAAGAPRVTLLVTSRAVLHISGEHVFPVLPLPDEDAVELFVQRARLLEPGFERTDENDEDLREICRRVDGLPLAVELAAARTRTLPPHRLRERLGERLATLTGGPSDLPARQQTLRETVSWSVGLLGDHEREVFARLAVFPAGATLEAAEEVCEADLDTLAVLVDDHLVHRYDVQREPRFGMLETIREYAVELLAGARVDVEIGMAEYFARLVDDMRLSDGTEHEWRRGLESLDPEIENLRAALTAAAASGDSALLVRLAGGLWRYWWVRGPASEGIEWIERGLAVDDGTATAHRARALAGGAGLAWSRGDPERAKELARLAIDVDVAAGSGGVYELGAHTVLGILANEERDYETARYHHLRAVEISERLGLDPSADKLNLGLVALNSGEREEAVRLFEGVLASHRRNDNPVGMGFALLNLGIAHHELGDHRAAQQKFEQAHALFEAIGFPQQVAYALQGLAACAASESHHEESARLLGQARRELDRIGSPPDAFSAVMIASTEALARAALGDEGFASAFDNSGEQFSRRREK